MGGWKTLFFLYKRPKGRRTAEERGALVRWRDGSLREREILRAQMLGVEPKVG